VVKYARAALMVMFGVAGIAALSTHDFPVALLLFCGAWYLERREPRW
jgi:hypothetical protein